MTIDDGPPTDGDLGYWPQSAREWIEAVDQIIRQQRPFHNPSSPFPALVSDRWVLGRYAIALRLSDHDIRAVSSMDQHEQSCKWWTKNNANISELASWIIASLLNHPDVSCDFKEPPPFALSDDPNPWHWDLVGWRKALVGVIEDLYRVVNVPPAKRPQFDETYTWFLGRNAARIEDAAESALRIIWLHDEQVVSETFWPKEVTLLGRLATLIVARLGEGP